MTPSVGSQAALKITPESPSLATIWDRLFSNKESRRKRFRNSGAFFPRSAKLKGRLNLAGALLRSGRVTEAIAEYEKVLAIKPDFAQGHLDLGHALMRAERLADAIGAIQNCGAVAASLCPCAQQPRDGLRCKAAWGEAIRCWRETLEINPDNVAAQSGLAWTLATAPDPALRNGAEALAISQHLPKPLARRTQCSFAFSQPPTPKQGGFPKRSKRPSVESRSQLRNTTRTSQLFCKMI